MEPEEDLRSSLRPGRAGRALALMAVSVLVIGIATVAYIHPQLPHGFGTQAGAGAVHVPAGSYQLAAIDFVDTSTGWVVAELPSHDFAVLHTTDAGRSWTRQLSGIEGDIGEYAKFFDSLHGVVVVLGRQAALCSTRDGGKTWGCGTLQEGGGYVLSAGFVDPVDGWLLVQEGSAGGATTEGLFHTTDGGKTWLNQGDPVPAPDWAFRIVFADPLRGWLYSLSSGPNAYGTADGGSSWRRIALPAPPGGWPVAPAGSPGPEKFFVAASPTQGPGVAAAVVPIAPPKGRSVDGGIVMGYPPLRIRAFDGGVLVTVVYTTFGDMSPYRDSAILSEGGQALIPAAPGEIELSSLDGGSSWEIAALPSEFGTFGYVDPTDWWWIGAGAWATSSDGGVTWTRMQTLSTLAPLAGSLRIIDLDHGWFASMNGAMPLLEATDDGGHTWRTVGLPSLTP
jgi:photosystem II stability/assembly factor-like uncharacterized protein